MRKTLLAVALMPVFATPALAADAPASEHTVTGNVGVFSSYRFRGIDQTFGEAALQGGFDYAHASGLYVGNWNSNVSETAGYPDGNLEMDLYAGYKKSFGDFGLDVGGIYYYYPGSTLNNKTVSNTEVYVGGSWKFVSLKYYYATSDYFGTKGPNGEDTDGTQYLDLAASYDLGGGWGVNAHVGSLKYKSTPDGDYVDYKLGVTKDVGGYVFGAAYIDTDVKNTFYTFANGAGKTKDLGRSSFVLNVSKSF